MKKIWLPTSSRQGAGREHNGIDDDNLRGKVCTRQALSESWDGTSPRSWDSPCPSEHIACRFDNNPNTPGSPRRPLRMRYLDRPSSSPHCAAEERAMSTDLCKPAQSRGRFYDSVEMCTRSSSDRWKIEQDAQDRIIVSALGKQWSLLHSMLLILSVLFYRAKLTLTFEDDPRLPRRTRRSWLPKPKAISAGPEAVV
jgi:hypothetical protein